MSAFDPAEYAARIAALRGRMSKAGVDAVLLDEIEPMIRVAGYGSSLNRWRCLIVSLDSEPFILIRVLDATPCRQATWRLIKSPAGIALLRSAAAIGDEAIRRGLRPGRIAARCGTGGGGDLCRAERRPRPGRSDHRRHRPGLPARPPQRRAARRRRCGAFRAAALLAGYSVHLVRCTSLGPPAPAMNAVWREVFAGPYRCRATVVVKELLAPGMRIEFAATAHPG